MPSDIFTSYFSNIITSSTADVMDSWIKLRNVKKEEELKEQDWKELEKAYMDHLQWRFKYQAKIFRQQIISTWMITIMVMGLVIAGLTFSLIQLYSAIKLGNLSNLTTELSIETAGKLSFQSSIVGASVLIISLLFFYLYLKHVFDIKHPIPPHISIRETDAQQVFSSKNNDVSPKG